MREIRRDPTTGDLTVLSTERSSRPRHLMPGRVVDADRSVCPFCPGHEPATPPPIAAVERDGRWVVRCFPNKYPALRIEGAVDRRAVGPYDRTAGIGAHEVIVESPDHDVPSWADERQGADALRMARDRLRDLARDGRFRHLVWFRNVGPEAGATLAHPHAQVVAMPVVPSLAKRMSKLFRRHWREHERDLLQDLLDADLADGRRVVWESTKVVAVCPWAPKTSFETWLVPTSPAPSFLDADDATIDAVAKAMGVVLSAMSSALENPPYNAVLYTAPRDMADGWRWHIRILPRLAAFAGFELATAASICGILPEDAAQILRERRRT